MIDHFARLEVPRRPLLDEAALKERYHLLTAGQHPDVAGADAGSPFADLTVAYRALVAPRTRLRHLLELEAPGESFRGVAAPPGVDNLFPRVGEVRQKLDAFLKKRAASATALSKALLLPEQYELQEAVEALLTSLGIERDRWLAGLPELDAAWQRGERPIPALSQLAQALGYLDKWSDQLREGLLRLQFEE